MERETKDFGDEIRALAYRVFGLLHHYIDVHNDMLGRKWLRWLRRIDFEANATKLAQISRALALARTHALEIQSSAGLAAGHQEYLRVLVGYIDALSHTVELLAGVAKRLAGSARGEPYSLTDYRREMKEYQLAAEHYREIGESLKGAWDTAEL